MKLAASFWGRLAGLDFSIRMAIAVVFSLGIHLVTLGGLNFIAPDARKLNDTKMPLEVVLVNSKSATKPTHADALAQANLDGGGNTDLDRRAKSPIPVLKNNQPNPDTAQAAQHVQELEQQAQKLMTQVKSSYSLEHAKSKPESPSEKTTAINTVNLAERALEMARLEAQVSQDWDAYQKRPKRTFIGARTSEYSFARYVEDWRIKVERVGNLNYPEEAKQQKLYGSLQLTVSIKADGSLENVEINRSSGHKALDQSAIRIVKLAAPYAAFGDDIRKKTDILSITRTWIFARGDQLTSE